MTTHALLLHDRLAPPSKHEAYLEVLDPYPRNGCIKVFDAEKQEDRYIATEKLINDIHACRLTVLRKGKPRFSWVEQPEDSKLFERCRSIQQAMRRIYDIQAGQGVSFHVAYQRAAEEYLRKGGPQAPAYPKLSTMYRYRQCERAGLPILRGDKNKGNRSRRYPQEVDSVICMLAEKHYLVPHSRWSLQHLAREVNRQVRGSVLAPNRPAITEKYIRQVIRRFVTADPEASRMLAMDVIAGKSYAQERIHVEAPFERVEQDALHLPFVVSTDSGVSSQIYLVHAIDCCTGYPLGWHLVVGAPTEADTLACIEMYMAPIKAKRFKALGIDHDMNVCGTPGQLLFDNGAETKGRRIQNLEKLGVDVIHCRARAGQEKPFIERFNRSLKEALEGLAGCTRLDGKDGKRDPIALGDKLKSLRELEVWIVRWYYEKWIHHSLARLNWDAVMTQSLEGGTPMERWTYFESACIPISLPPSRSEWLAALYEHAHPRLSRKTGISIQGLNFKGGELPALLDRYGESTVHVLFNPDDFRHVYVYESEELPLITLEHEHLRPETPAWSFAEVKERLKAQRAKVHRAPQAEHFDSDLLSAVVLDSDETKPRRKSKYERNRETAKAEKAAKAAARAATTPTPPPKRGRAAVPLDAKPNPLPLESPMVMTLLDRNSGDLI